MNVFDELKDVIEIKINQEALAEKIFDQAVMPLLEKLVDIIPTEFDNMLLTAKKEELRGYFKESLVKGVDYLEEKTGVDLDGQEG